MKKEFKLRITILQNVDGKIIFNNEAYGPFEESKKYELPISLIILLNKLGVASCDYSYEELEEITSQIVENHLNNLNDLEVIEELEKLNIDELIKKLENETIKEIKNSVLYVEISNPELNEKIYMLWEEIQEDPESFARLYFFRNFYVDSFKNVYKKVIDKIKSKCNEKLIKLLEKTQKFIELGYSISDLENLIGSKNVEFLQKHGYLSVETIPKLTLKALEDIAKSSIFSKLGFRIRSIDKSEIRDRMKYTYKFVISENEILQFFEVVKIGGSFFIVDWLNKEILIPQDLRIEIPEIIKNIVEDVDNLDVDYEKLFDNILNFSKKSLYFADERDHIILIAFVILSWIQEILTVAPFIRVLQPFGTGKSIFSKFLYKFCYRALLSSSATVASIARASHYHGITLIVDELKKSDKEEEDEFLTILRVRHTRETGQYIKSKQGSESEIISLNVFGITSLAGRNPMPDDIESRCIRISLIPAPKKWKSDFYRIEKNERKGIIKDLIKLRISKCSNPDLIINHKEQILHIRDKLIEAGFDHRFSEIFAPIIYVVPEKYRKDLIDRIKTMYEERRSSFQSSEETEIVSIISKLYYSGIAEEVNNPLITLGRGKNVKRIPFINVVLEYSGIGDKSEFDKLKPSEKKSLETKVGIILKRLDIKTKRMGNNNERYIIISEDEVKTLIDKYLTESEIANIDINNLPSFSLINENNSTTSTTLSPKTY